MAIIQVTAENFTPRVQRWLQKSQAAKLLHLFDQVINLIDADGEIISVVQPKIGPGPFSLLIGEERPFPHLITPHTPVSKTATSLTIGALQIDCRSAAVWLPVPNWQALQARWPDWQKNLPGMQTAVAHHLSQLGNVGPANFSDKFTDTVAAMLEPNREAWPTAVAQLAGFGPGFTPAGDDFLVGFLFGLWATRPKDEVVELAKIVVETAVPRTTQLSAAWLQAAACGEAWQPWHELVDALSTGRDWQLAVQRILNQGATSGLVALLGFIAAA